MSTDDSLPADYAIPIIPASELDYTRAWQDFYKPNLPFIVTGLTDNWPARKNWVKHVRPSKRRNCGEGIDEGVDDREPAWEYLKEQYGHFEVSVLQCAVPASTKGQITKEGHLGSFISEDLVCDIAQSTNDESKALGYGHGDMREMLFKDVVDLWKRGEGKGLYIKDWHLRRELRDEQRQQAATADERDLASSSFKCATGAATTHQAAPAPAPSETTQDEAGNDKTAAETSYTTPDIFKDDWMDNYYTNETQDDFAFVYFGTKGTFTPLHRDVYTSYSWSANILGRKRWHFVPPSSVPYCRIHLTSSTSVLHSDIRPGAINTSKHPSFLKARVFEIEQPEGSIIFVPSDWHHCVENLDEFVISINQNWGNSVNLENMYASMRLAVRETEEALLDVREVLERRGKQVQSGKTGRSAVGRAGAAGSQPSEVHLLEESGKSEIMRRDNEEEEEFEIEREWDEIVQQVLEQNVGWGWKTFYAMIEYNLLHPPAPLALSPPKEHLVQVLSSIFDFQDTCSTTHESQGSANVLGNTMESLHVDDEPAAEQKTGLEGNGESGAQRPWSNAYLRARRAAEAVIYTYKKEKAEEEAVSASPNACGRPKREKAS